MRVARVCAHPALVCIRSLRGSTNGQNWPGQRYALAMKSESADDESSRPAVVLGSGFSRAIADAMPTMPELGSAVLDELGLGSEVLVPFGGNLEQWMSFLSIDQPWLTTAQNYDNRGMFARVSEAVYACILRAETDVIQEPMPIWLQRLAWTWCDQRARIFCFNYDTLVERAASGVNRFGTLADIYVAALTDRQAPGDGAMFGPGPARGPLLSLYKLHGSTSWAFGGLDGPSNDRITLWNSSLRWGINPPNEEEESPRYASLYDDLVPLIVPPTLTKGPFFSNLALRAQWRRAAEALRSAETLTILGYSFPAADLVAQQWVSTSFSGNRMDVVDKVAERPGLIRTTVTNAPDGDDITGDQAIERFVDRACGDYVAWRIWQEPDEIGVRASLSVNGENLLEGMTPATAPWGSMDPGDAQRWVQARVEEAGGVDAVDGAQGSFSGWQENRYVVLAPGRHLTL
jgi:hypothetical protein